MGFKLSGDSARLDASVEDMKLVYRTLHRHLSDHLELMDCELFDALQGALQEKAQAEGVDIGHHTAWDLWLGNENPVTCEERVKKRKTL